MITSIVMALVLVTVAGATFIIGNRFGRKTTEGIVEQAEEAAAKDASDARRSQVRTVDRSERIRTYNFPENRLNDHRVGFKSHNLDQILDGDIDAVIQACIDADNAAKLSSGGAE